MHLSRQIAELRRHVMLARKAHGMVVAPGTLVEEDRVLGAPRFLAVLR